MLAGEKVRVEKNEKGQQKPDTLFQKVGQGKGSAVMNRNKRKREEGTDEDDM